MWNITPCHHELIEACGEDDYTYEEGYEIEEEYTPRFSKALPPNQVCKNHHSICNSVNEYSFPWKYGHSIDMRLNWQPNWSFSGGNHKRS